MKRLLLVLLLVIPCCAQQWDTIAATNAACVSGACAYLNLGQKDQYAVVQLTGTFTATVQFEATADNTTFVSIAGVPSGGGSAVTSATAAGAWQFNVAGYKQLRVRGSAYTSGAATVKITVGQAGSMSSLSYPGVTSDGASGLTVAGTLAVGTTVLNSTLGEMPIADWCVDAVNGSDYNDGKCDANGARPFKTIGTLLAQTITAGQTIVLFAGSVWREMLTIPASNVTVIGWGYGNKPLLDGSDVIPASAWSKTGGYTNVYQATVSVSAVGGNGVWVNAFENGAQMVRKSSLANIDATAGSYAVTGFSDSQDPTGSVTLYIHATGDGNPSSNGSTYEYTNRQFAVRADVNAIHHVTLINVAGRRGAGYSQVQLGAYSTLINCVSTQASDHNIYVGPYSTIRGGLVQDAYYGNDNDYVKAMIILNGDGTGAETFTVDNVTVVGNGNTDKNAGVMSHTNNAGQFGSVTVKNARISNTYQGIVLNTVNAVTVANTSANYLWFDANTVSVNVDKAVLAGRIDVTWRTIESAGGTPNVTVTNSTITGRSGIWTSGGKLTLRNNSLNAVFYGVQINSGTLAEFHASGNSLATTTDNNWYYYFANNPTVIDSDYNTAVAPGTNRRVYYNGGTNTWAQWKALGFEAHSN